MDTQQLYLTGKQARSLRALGHHLKVTAMVGKEGITESVCRSVDQVLTAHELVKVKIQENCPTGKTETAQELARRTKSRIAQILGRTFLLYRANQEIPADKRIQLP